MKYPFDLIHLGRETSVTGSCRQIMFSGISIMVDCCCGLSTWEPSHQSFFRHRQSVYPALCISNDQI
jgi:hypothetical protein